MSIIKTLSEKWKGIDSPFLIDHSSEMRFEEISNQENIDLSSVNKGDVVALIGDFNPLTISILLQLIDLGTIIVPLTKETKKEHEYFFQSAYVNVVIENGKVRRRSFNESTEYIENLRRKKHTGLVLFSTGTTGRPKAILHDFTFFLKRYKTSRPTLRTINFLLFDHIGGINTLLHTLFNKGVVIAPKNRSPAEILKTCKKYNVELLPTTPTFLRMMLLSGLVPDKVPASLKIITYGTELMDQPTLDELCKLLPKIDFRQTFGMSELGIVRVKSEARDSLYMKIGGEGIETRVVNNVLQIRSETRMLGYLNASSPFDEEGWYDTKDIVERKEDLYKITGRVGDVINVGGLKFMASEVERIAFSYPEIALVKVYSRNNPVTGQHVEMVIQPKSKKNFNLSEFKNFLSNSLQTHMIPKRIVLDKINIGHRFKKL